MSDGIIYKWLIVTQRGGETIAGPFSTAEDAVAARKAIEQLTSKNTYWITRTWHCPHCGKRLVEEEK